jgi:hypothetical protein
MTGNNSNLNLSKLGLFQEFAAPNFPGYNFPLHDTSDLFANTTKLNQPLKHQFNHINTVIGSNYHSLLPLSSLLLRKEYGIQVIIKLQ